MVTVIKCENAKLLTVVKTQSNAGVRPTVDDVGLQIEVVEHLKYLGSLKSADGNCNNDIPNWNGQEKNARSGTDLERQRNKQRAANGTIISCTRW